MGPKRYWFPVHPARNGWGWGLPIAWQGWVAFLVFFVLLIGLTARLYGRLDMRTHLIAP